jgi:hypothetical protein
VLISGVNINNPNILSFTVALHNYYAQYDFVIWHGCIDIMPMLIKLLPKVLEYVTSNFLINNQESI